MDTKKAGKLGGQARKRNLTPEQRSEAAKRASIIRWAQWRAARDRAAKAKSAA